MICNPQICGCGLLVGDVNVNRSRAEIRRLVVGQESDRWGVTVTENAAPVAS
jgi:hypothetical protein